MCTLLLMDICTYFKSGPMNFVCGLAFNFSTLVIQNMSTAAVAKNTTHHEYLKTIDVQYSNGQLILVLLHGSVH